MIMMSVKRLYRKSVGGLASYFLSKLRRWKMEEKTVNVSLLSPVDNYEEHKEYIVRLGAAIQSDDVFNIALTGAYGAGKSSILKTLRSVYPQYRYVNVSLASFVEEKHILGNKEDKPGDDFEKQLEYSILQQLFYHVKASDIPESRFGRIIRSSFWTNIFSILSFWLFAASCLVLFYEKNICELFPISRTFLERGWLRGSCFVVFSLLLIKLSYSFLLWLKRYDIKKMSMDKTSLELEKRNDISVMNQYLDEIVYLFQNQKFDVLILEDIDRFDNIQIFTKLRELNLILNHSGDIGRRIVFIYALKDDIFNSAEARTKFFDYIIPVIPYVNISNSGDLFRRKMKDLNISETEISSSFLTDISAFVSDMRVLTNIVNEFDLYRKILDKKLNCEKLLAMILYKNLYPTDFALLHQNKGVVYESFMSINQLKEELSQRNHDAISSTDAEIQALNDEQLTDLDELNSLVVGKFLSLQPHDCKYIYEVATNSTVDRKRLFEEEYVLKILKGGLGFRDVNWYYKHIITSKDMKDVLSEAFDYKRRKKSIEDKNKNMLSFLQNARKAYLDELGNIGKMSLCDIARSDKDIFKHVNCIAGKSGDYQVLKYLLERGYIDEQYFFYISLFQEGRLTPTDRDFLLSIKFKKSYNYDYHLVEIPSLLQNLSSIDFECEGIINFDLLGYCLENEQQYGDKGDIIIRHLLNCKDYTDLVFQYISIGKCVDVFLRRLLLIDYGIWNVVIGSNSYSDDRCDMLLNSIFRYADVQDISEANTQYPFSEYINNKTDYYKIFENIDSQRVYEILDFVNLKVLYLQDDNIYDYLVEHNMYAINMSNVKVIFRHEHLAFGELETACLTTIRKSNIKKLVGLVNQELATFVGEMMFAKNNTKESEETMRSLLEDEALSNEVKIELVQHNDTVLNNCCYISDVSILSVLFEENKVMANMDNINHYFFAAGATLDDVLCSFVNLNEKEVINSIANMQVVGNGNDAVGFDMLLSDKINDNIAIAIIENYEFHKVCLQALPKLSEIRVIALLDTGFLQMSPEIYYQVTERYPSLSRKILCMSPSVVMTDIDKYDLNAETLSKMLEWEEYHEYESVLLSKIDITKMSSMTADNLLYYFAKDTSKFDLSIFTKAMEKSNNPVTKFAATTRCLTKRIIALSELSRVFERSGDVFEKLQKQGGTFGIPKQIKGAFEFMKTLQDIKYIGKISDDGNEYKARVRVHKFKNEI